MEHKDIAREWFTIADQDMASTEFLKQMKPIPCEIICYHCQQRREIFKRLSRF